MTEDLLKALAAVPLDEYTFFEADPDDEEGSSISCTRCLTNPHQDSTVAVIHLKELDEVLEDVVKHEREVHGA